MTEFDVSRRSGTKSFAFSPENPTGTPAGGSRGKPWEKVHPAIQVQPGETITLADTDGPGKIQSIWMGGDICNQFILRMYWDGQDAPSVEVPQSAFFGYGFPQNVTDQAGEFPTLNSAMVLVAPCRGMNCYWPMPFRTHCRITLENRSPDKAKWVYYCITGAYGPQPEDAMYFHASYRQSRPVPADGEYTILDGVAGCGQLAGIALSAGLNGHNGCWVEGEMKMYLDGDAYPSINYTGTEDYFCGSYAFGYDKPEVGKYTQYSGLYAGMYAVLGDRTGHYNCQPRFMLYRWHVPDPICFDTSIRVVLENMHFTSHGHRPRRDDYASTAYWYQTTPAVSLSPLPTDEELELL